MGRRPPRSRAIRYGHVTAKNRTSLMSKTLPDFVSDDPSAPADPAPEPVVEAAPAAEATPEPVPAAEGQPRDAGGKFAPIVPAVEAAPAVEPVVAAPAAPVPTPPPEQAFAPLAALLDERDKRQAAEKRAKELEDWRTQQEAQARRQPPPDPTQDPEAFRQHQAQQLDQVFWDQRLEMSRGFAEMRHGAETTAKAYEWGLERCDADPYFNAKVRASKDPIGLVVGEWQREQLLAKVTPEDLAAFETWKQAQAAPAPVGVAHQLAAAPAAPPTPLAPPRPSLAGAPSASTSASPVPRDGEATFAKMFG